MKGDISNMRKNTQYDAIIMEAGAKYNAGPYAKWLKAGKNPPTQETREYMDAIPKI